MKLNIEHEDTNIKLDQHNRSERSVKNAGSVIGKGAILALGTMLILEPSVALAADMGKWASVLQEVINFLTGPIGKGAAVIAVISMGFMAMGGKLAWDTAIKVVLGIVLIFSSVTIASWLSGTATSGTASSFVTDGTTTTP